MKAIVCVDKNWGIGKNNGLLFSLPTDMKFFRDSTKGKVVVMGGNTLRSFPNSNPLPNRVNIVLSRKLERDDLIVCKRFSDLMVKLKEYDTHEIFIIGGASFYEQMLDYCEEALVTKVEGEGGADTFFPNLDKNPSWECVYESGEIVDNGLKIKFTTYKNKDLVKF